MLQISLMAVTMLLGWRSRADLLRLGRLCRSDRPSARYKRYLRLGELARLHGMPSISNRETVPHNYNDRFYKSKKFPKLINVTIKNADHSMSDSISLRNISISI